MSLELAPLGSPQTQALGQALATEYRNYLAPFEEPGSGPCSISIKCRWPVQVSIRVKVQLRRIRRLRPSDLHRRHRCSRNQSTAEPAQLQGQQASMMPQNQSQQPQQMQMQGVGPQPPSLAGFNPPPPPILSAEHLAKVGMTQEQFNKVFLSQQLNAWRQEQQRQMNQGFRPTNPVPASLACSSSSRKRSRCSNNNSSSSSSSSSSRRRDGRISRDTVMPQTLELSHPRHSLLALVPACQVSRSMCSRCRTQIRWAPPCQTSNRHLLSSRSRYSRRRRTSRSRSSRSRQNAQSGPGQMHQEHSKVSKDKMAGRPSNMSQARFIAVSPSSSSRHVRPCRRSTKSWRTQRPRLPIIQNIADDERDQILDQVQKLAPIQATVTALLPAFYAMNGNLEPAKRLKIMAFMYKDQYDLLSKKQCILRLADLDKLKMQMSRCISFVRSSKPGAGPAHRQLAWRAVARITAERRRLLRSREAALLQQRRPPTRPSPRTQRSKRHL